MGWPDRSPPVQVAGLTGMMSISHGGGHTLALKGDGTVWAWGRNVYGQLGDGMMAIKLKPVPVIAPASPDVAISVKHAREFRVGEQGTYAITVTNVGGTDTAEGITVTDILPPGLTYSSVAGSGWQCAAAGQTVTCANPGPILPGVSTTITLTVTVASQADPAVTNTAMASNASDRNTSNNAAADPTMVLADR